MRKEEGLTKEQCYALMAEIAKREPVVKANVREYISLGVKALVDLTESRWNILIR